MRRFAIYLLSLIIIPLSGWSQQAFDCDGTAYISVVKEGVSTFYEISLGDQDIRQTPISSGYDHNINAIGFNQRDSLIYSIDPETNQLFRMGSDGILEGIRYLALEGDYYAGDIHPDGDALILVNSDFLAIIRLEESENPITYIPITTTSENATNIVTTDIAYHPLTKVLYGYDALEGKLITINDSTGMVDNSSFPSIQYNNSIPALLFDARGELYGLGTNNADQESILFHFDLESGSASRSSFDGNTGDRDGCSCPFTVKLFQKISNDYLAPCSSMRLVLTISNLTGETLESYQLTEDLPEGYLIEEIVYNPYVSVGPLNTNSNTLRLTDMRIEHGIDSIVVLVSIPETAAGESHSIQATLARPNGDNTVSYLSDDLVFAEKNDPTAIHVRSIETIFEALIPQKVELCEEDTFVLHLPVTTDFQYIWSDGYLGNERIFGEDSNLALEVVSACKRSQFELSVMETDFSVSMGADIYANYGDVVSLSATSTNQSTIAQYTWKTIEGDIDCNNCSTIQIEPREDTKYILVAKNETGCISSDEINVFINREVYVPNIFSPNGDGINDYFYIQSSYPSAPIEKFQIYNRWGEQVFQSEETLTNVELNGWNGHHKGKPASIGTYFWSAAISFNERRSVFIQGQFILQR